MACERRSEAAHARIQLGSQGQNRRPSTSSVTWLIERVRGCVQWRWIARDGSISCEYQPAGDDELGEQSGQDWKYGLADASRCSSTEEQPEPQSGCFVNGCLDFTALDTICACLYCAVHYFMTIDSYILLFSVWSTPWEFLLRIPAPSPNDQNETKKAASKDSGGTAANGLAALDSCKEEIVTAGTRRRCASRLAI